MNTELQQTLTLVIAANLMIAGRPAPRFEVGEGIFRFWERYTFVEEARGFLGRPSRRVIAEGPQAWLDKTAASARAVRAGSTAVNHAMISDRESSGFAGGGARWIIEVETEGGFDLWQPALQLGDRGRKDQRIWRSDIWRVARGGARWTQAGASLEAATDELAAALEGVLAFAAAQGIDNFADIFRGALGHLRGEDALSGPPLFPGLALSDAALRLMEASGSAFVFGGMGSWNDFSFDGEDEAVYRRCSDRLYEAIQAALPAAVNSSAAD